MAYKNHETLHHINLTIPKNEITVIVGQSGSGKSTLLKATISLLSEDARLVEGDILFKGQSLRNEDLNNYRGKKIGVIFQNPLTYFDDFILLSIIFMKRFIIILIIQKKNQKKLQSLI